MKDSGEKMSLQEEGKKAFPKEQREQQANDSIDAFTYSLLIKKQLENQQKHLDHPVNKRISVILAELLQLHEQEVASLQKFKEIYDKDIAKLQELTAFIIKTFPSTGNAGDYVVDIAIELLTDLKKGCKEWEEIANLGYYKEFRAEQAKVEALERDLEKYKAFHAYIEQNVEDVNLYESALKVMEQAARNSVFDLKA